MNKTPDCTLCLQKQEELKQLLLPLSHEMRYQKIIALGRSLAPFPPEQMQEENLVSGCQSILYLYAELRDGKAHFYVGGDALISVGLAALLLFVYNDQPPEALFTCPPLFLQDLDLFSLLTPSRANGLSGLYQKMKLLAAKMIAEKNP